MYESDRVSALKRTLNPRTMISWIYDSMGQMPEEHFKYWVWLAAIGFYRFSKNLFAAIGVIVVLNDFVFQLLGIPPFVGHHDTIIHAAHRLAHWLGGAEETLPLFSSIPRPERFAWPLASMGLFHTRSVECLGRQPRSLPWSKHRAPACVLAVSPRSYPGSVKSSSSRPLRLLPGSSSIPSFYRYKGIA